MSNTAQTFASLVGTIMRTPIEAVAQAERDYLRMWRDRLEAMRVPPAPGGNPVPALSAEEIKATLAFVPVMKLVGDIQVATTVRLASVREMNGKLGLTIGVGPIGINGGFGFLNRATEESIIQISATFKLTNGEVSLLDYLKDVGKIDLAAPSDITKAIDFLNRKVEQSERAIDAA
jgi:hypothetical protein